MSSSRGPSACWVINKPAGPSWWHPGAGKRGAHAAKCVAGARSESWPVVFSEGRGLFPSARQGHSGLLVVARTRRFIPRWVAAISEGVRFERQLHGFCAMGVMTAGGTVDEPIRTPSGVSDFAWLCRSDGSAGCYALSGDEEIPCATPWCGRKLEEGTDAPDSRASCATSGIRLLATLTNGWFGGRLPAGASPELVSAPGGVQAAGFACGRGLKLEHPVSLAKEIGVGGRRRCREIWVSC